MLGCDVTLRGLVGVWGLMGCVVVLLALFARACWWVGLRVDGLVLFCGMSWLLYRGWCVGGWCLGVA